MNSDSPTKQELIHLPPKIRQKEEEKAAQQFRKLGAPFKGTVKDQSNELHITEKRGLFRAFKSYYAKDLYIDGKSWDGGKKFLVHLEDPKVQFAGLLRQLSPAAVQKIEQGIKTAKLTCTFTQKTTRLTAEEEELIAILRFPCYRYSKMAKEQFFENPYMCFLFLHFITHAREFLAFKWGAEDAPAMQEVRAEMVALAESSLKAAAEAGDIDLQLMFDYCKPQTSDSEEAEPNGFELTLMSKPSTSQNL